jgi:hypothetical protein
MELLADAKPKFRAKAHTLFDFFSALKGGVINPSL